jgi:gliding motility-associated-like protein
MKKLLFILLLFSGLSASAAHIYGGEMVYTYLGPGTAPNTNQYRITLKLFRQVPEGVDSSNIATLPGSVWIGIFDYGSKQHYPSTQSHYDVPRTAGPYGFPVTVAPCVTGDKSGKYQYAEYSLVVDLPINSQGYIASWQTCCRISNPLPKNIAQTQSTGSGTGVTYVAKISGTNQLDTAKNSSPQFTTTLDLVCHNSPFTWNFSATDIDDDSLVYSFAPAYNKTTATGAANFEPTQPSGTGGSDYPTVTYINGFTGASPLGALAYIDPKTGIISGISPEIGHYVVAVVVREYRKGVLIGEHRKDIILRVQDCEQTQALLNPEYITCDGFSYSFKNNAPKTAEMKSWYWDFGVPSRADDTSNLEFPNFTFPDTGVFKVTLILNRGLSCTDTATTFMKVYPGFFPAFTASGLCVNKPTQFTDATTTAYGTVNSWRWFLGDQTTVADTSHAQNPTWTYNQTGLKTVQLIVTNSKGCVDTLPQTIDILAKPTLAVDFPDTLICRGDTVRLKGIGTGTFTWAPNTNISNPNVADPIVNPINTTMYYVELNQNGCLNNDSVRVRVVNFVSLDAMPDTVICLTDSAQLGAVTNGLKFLWSPSAEMDDPTLLRPKVKPTGTTDYQITAFIGSCSTTDQVRVSTVPYPISDAGKDTVICWEGSVQLHASITGSSFVWSPTISLTNANTLDPIAKPRTTTAYVLTVTDDLGCPKPKHDTVLVKVLPKIRANAGRDTLVVVGQPLQLLATGGVRYHWIPATSLSSDTIRNPIGLYDGSFDSIRYKVLVYNQADCVDSTHITVRIFKTDPRIFVPTAFTPNGDGLNDIVRPIAAGMEKINYFRIYNRWGQLVFSTTINGHGWDGKINGKVQGTEVFVWLVKAVDYKGEVFFAKGTVTLIR